MPIAPGKKRSDKLWPIIVRLFSRPFKRRLSQVARSSGGKAILRRVRFVEDFTPSDFNARKKHFHLWNKLMTTVKKYASREENSSLTEEKFMLFSLNSLLFVTFEKRQWNDEIFMLLLRSPVPQDTRAMSSCQAEIACAALHKSEFCAKPA